MIVAYMSNLDKAFNEASVEEQEEFVKKRHRILCRIVSNAVQCSLCYRFQQVAKEIMTKQRESFDGKGED